MNQMVRLAKATSQLRNRLLDPQGRIRLGLPGRGHPAGQFVEYVRPRVREIVVDPRRGEALLDQPNSAWPDNSSPPPIAGAGT
jgi:hypothetical protein